jgi:hypothetical protein
LVPLCVTAFTSTPANVPCRTSNGERSTWYSFTARIEMERAFACPPGWPVEPRPNASDE